MAKLAETLAAEERERAARFRFAEHWDRFIAKALGGGLASGLRNLEVCFLDGGLPDGRVSLRDAAGGMERAESAAGPGLGRGAGGGRYRLAGDQIRRIESKPMKVQAVWENGVFRPTTPLTLRRHSVTIQAPDDEIVVNEAVPATQPVDRRGIPEAV